MNAYNKMDCWVTQVIKARARNFYAIYKTTVKRANDHLSIKAHKKTNSLSFEQLMLCFSRMNDIDV